MSRKRVPVPVRKRSAWSSVVHVELIVRLSILNGSSMLYTSRVSEEVQHGWKKSTQRNTVNLVDLPEMGAWLERMFIFLGTQEISVIACRRFSRNNFNGVPSMHDGCLFLGGLTFPRRGLPEYLDTKHATFRSLELMEYVYTASTSDLHLFCAGEVCLRHFKWAKENTACHLFSNPFLPETSRDGVVGSGCTKEFINMW